MIRLITEELHSFNTQYSLAQELTNIVINMLHSNVMEYTYTINNNETLHQVTFTIATNTSYPKARIMSVNQESKAIGLEILIPNTYKQIPLGDFQRMLLHTITHELMHSYIFINRIGNSQTIEDAPQYYENLLQIANQMDDDTLAHQMAILMYSTYYHESQAIISQTAIDVKMILKQNNNMNPTASDILEVLRKTEGYNLIANSLKRFIPHILRTNDSVIQTKIVDVFHQFQIPCDVKTIRSSCKKMKPQLMKMMRKIAKNAMLAYDKIDEVRRLYTTQTQTRKRSKSKLLEILNKN